MKKILLFIFIVQLSIFANEIKAQADNHWLKIYKNYKNYNIVVNNITKLEEKLKSQKLSNEKREELNKKLSINRSKLYLYQNNNSFDIALLKYKTEMPKINLFEFLFKNELNEFNKTLKKYQKEKLLFYKAKSILQNEFDTLEKNDSKNLKLRSLKNDIDYFNEYSENIEKVEQNLIEFKIDLENKYDEYKEEVFIKHIFTIVFIVVLYILYKVLSYVILYFINSNDKELNKNYSKLLALLFAITIFLFISIRYINDLIYFITFLGVVAAALTIAMREVLLNIAGAIYIFFTSIIKVGDRVMVQFETKHTIGDITNISLVKIKLNEIDDYSNIKEVKAVGRTIYIPNSYIFTKVFYNYSLKKNGIINDILEFEFDSNNDFDMIEDIISTTLKNEFNLNHKISFALNSTKTAIVCNISYETNFKEASKNRGLLSIKLLALFKENKKIKLKVNRTSVKQKENEGE